MTDNKQPCTSLYLLIPYWEKSTRKRKNNTCIIQTGPCFCTEHVSAVCFCDVWNRGGPHSQPVNRWAEPGARHQSWTRGAKTLARRCVWAEMSERQREDCQWCAVKLRAAGDVCGAFAVGLHRDLQDYSSTEPERRPLHSHITAVRS